MNSQSRFMADLWKWYVLDEELDCRVNYTVSHARGVSGLA